MPAKVTPPVPQNAASISGLILAIGCRSALAPKQPAGGFTLASGCEMPML